MLAWGLQQILYITENKKLLDEKSLLTEPKDIQQKRKYKQGELRPPTKPGR